VGPLKSLAPLPKNNERSLNELLRDFSLFMGREVGYFDFWPKKGRRSDIYRCPLGFFSVLFSPRNEQKMGFAGF